MTDQIKELLGENADEQTLYGVAAYIEENFIPKSVYSALSEENESLRSDIDSMKKTDRVREALRGMGVSDPDYVIYKNHGIGSFGFDEKGEPVGLEPLVRELASSSAAAVLFPKKREYVPSAGKIAAANPFTGEGFNLTEQGRIMRESPDTARRLAAAAGVKIN